MFDSHASVSAVDGGKVSRFGVATEALHVYGEEVTIADDATIFGDVVGGTLNIAASADVLGDRLSNTSFAPLRKIEWVVGFPPASPPDLLTDPDTSLTLPPGDYGLTKIERGVQVTFLPGTYTFTRLLAEPGSILNIKNGDGPVYLYAKKDIIVRGVQNLEVDQANVLLGAAGTTKSIIERAWSGIVVVPNAELELATLTAGDYYGGSYFAKKLTVRPHSYFLHQPFSPASFCETGTECSSFCPCGEGEQCIPDDDSPCEFGLACVSQGTISLCKPEHCVEDPEGTGCQVQCTPDCSHVTCGADLSDGCGGICEAACAPGQLGCTSNRECIGDATCVEGGGRFYSNVATEASKGACMPSTCLEGSSEPACGEHSDPCGTYCAPVNVACEDQECGTDPRTGEVCGQCGSDQQCWSGKCVIPFIEYPDFQLTGPIPPAAEIGSLKGEHNVTPLGRSTYSIPLRLPKGTGGLTPQLSFEFADGGSKRGIMGPGWSLGGTSKIHRCSAPQQQDFYLPLRTQNALPLSLCLDGKPLIFDQEWTDAEAQDDVRVYRLADYDGSKILHHLGPDDRFDVWSEFVVHRADGTIWTYSEKTFGQNPLDLYADISVVDEWLLTQVRDQFENKAEYRYEGQRGIGVTSYNYLSEITYSWTHTGVRRNLRTVNFAYIDKDDQLGREGGYRLQNRMEDSKLLTEVTVDLFDLAERSQRARVYKLHYAPTPASGLQRLYAVQECTAQPDDDDACMPATVFEYDDVVPESDEDFARRFGEVELDAIDVKLDGHEGIDFNALNYRAIHNGQMVPTITFDGDGDGLSELLQVHPVHGLPTLWLPELDEGRLKYPEPQVLTYAAENWVIPALCMTSAGVGDIDRDGRDEFLDTCSNNVYYLVLGNIDSEGVISSEMLFDVPRFGPAYFADIDGDGMLDIVQEDGTYVYFNIYEGRYSEGNEDGDIVAGARGFSETYKVKSVGRQTPSAPAPAPLLIDVDGDGVANLLHYHEESKQYVALSLKNSDQLTPTEQAVVDAWDDDVREAFGDWKNTGLYVEQPALLGGAVAADSMRVMDINGDGLQDIWYQKGNVGAPLVPAAGVFRIEPVEDSNVTVRKAVDVSSAIEQVNQTLIDYGIVGYEFAGASVVWLNEGGRFRPQPVVTREWLGETPGEDWPRSVDGDPIVRLEPWEFRGARAFDYDNDGQDELLVFGTDYGDYGWFAFDFDEKSDSGVFVNKKRIHGLPHDGKFYSRVPDNPHTWPDISYPIWEDLNGDTETDFLVAGFSGDSAFAPGIAQGAGTRLVAVTDGLGNRTTIDHGQGKAAATFGGECGTGQSSIGEVSKCLTRFGKAVTGVYGTSSDGKSLGGREFTYKNPRTAPFLFGTRVESRDTTLLSGETDSDGALVPVASIKEEYGDLTAGLLSPVRTWTYPFSFQPTDKRTLWTKTTELVGAQTSEWQRYVVEERGYELDFVFDVPHLEYKTTKVYEGLPPFEAETLRVEEHFSVGDRGLSGGVARDTFVAHTRVAEFSKRISHGDPPFERKWGLDLPQEITVRHERGGETLELTSLFEYYPDTHALKRRTDLPGDDRELVTDYGYDDAGNATQVTLTDATGEVREQSQSFGQRGLYPETITNAEGHEVHAYHDDLSGLPAIIQDANGFRTERKYDGFGRAIFHSDREGARNIQYGAVYDEPIEVDGEIVPRRYHIEVYPLDAADGSDAPRASSRYDFDSRGLLVRTDEPGLSTDQDTPRVSSERLYDWAGQLVAQSDSHRADSDDAITWLRREYDAWGRLTELSSPQGVKTFWYGLSAFSSWEDVAQGLDLKLTIDETSLQTATILDHTGAIVGTAEGADIRGDNPGYVTRFARGAFDRVTNVQDADGLETTILYTPDGLPRWTQDQDRGVRETGYSAFGEPVWTKDSEDEITNQRFDKLGRIVWRSNDDGVAEWFYDQRPGAEQADLGHLVGATSPDGIHIEYAYEDKPRRLPSSVSYTVGGELPVVLSQEFDAFARLIRTEYPATANGSFAVENQYDPNSGSLLAVAEQGSNDALWRITEVDDRDRLRQVELGNGVAEQYDYDPKTNQVSHRGVLDAAGSELSSLDYDYYDNGQVERRQLSFGDVSRDRRITYDWAGRIKSVNESGDNALDETFAFSPSGRLLSRTKLGAYTQDLDHLHAVSDVGDNHFTYDVRGNQLTREGPDVLGGLQGISYNRDNRPTKISMGVDGAPDNSSVEFLYDAFGRRILKIGSSGDETLTVENLYERTTANGKVSHSYRVRAGEGEILRVVRDEALETDTYHYLHRDNLSSVIFTTDDTGAPSELRDFDVFGAPVADETWAHRLPSFTGHPMDHEAGLVNMGARLYDPMFGLFTTADPLLLSGLGSQGLNAYSYANNDPVNLWDPNGMQTCDPTSECCGECNESFDDTEEQVLPPGTVAMERPVPTPGTLESEMEEEGLVSVSEGPVSEEPPAAAADTGDPAGHAAWGLAEDGTAWFGATVVALPSSYQGGLDLGSPWSMSAGAVRVVSVVGSALVLSGDTPEASKRTVHLYHGAVAGYSTIMQRGLDPERWPVWVTPSLAAAQNAIGPGRVLSDGQGADVGIVYSVVPGPIFDALQNSGQISPLRTFPGFGGGGTYPEYVLRSPEAVETFNRGIVVGWSSP